MARLDARKCAKCPGCCPDGGAILKVDLATDDNYNSIRDDNGQLLLSWHCLNCGWQSKPIRPRRSFTPNTISARQQETLDRLRTSLPQLHAGNSYPDYEWKKWDVKTTEYGPVWLNCEHGLKGDEGTVGEVLGRDSWYLQIGPRGGLKFYSAPKWSTAKTTRHDH